MTFIGITTSPTQLQVVTDTLGSRSNKRYLWSTSNGKERTFPEHRLIAVSTGDSFAGETWRCHVGDLLGPGDSYDTLLPRVSPADCASVEGQPTMLYLAGWSPSQARFLATAWCNFDDFRPMPLGEAHYSQHPQGWAQLDDMTTRYYQSLARTGHHRLLAAQVPSGDRRDVPRTDADWLEVFRAARETVKYHVPSWSLPARLLPTHRRHPALHHPDRR